jgi:hypothetical protein
MTRSYELQRVLPPPTRHITFFVVVGWPAFFEPDRVNVVNRHVTIFLDKAFEKAY